jgi:SAM-dependent methyltransferase
MEMRKAFVSSLPPLKRWGKKVMMLGEERNRLIGQRDALASERDELQQHCKRISGQLAESLAREERLQQERADAVSARDALASERDELSAHCLRLSQKNETLIAYASKHGPSIAVVVEEMRLDWDRRALENALHYTNTARTTWDGDEYFSTGEANVREHVLNDMENICQGTAPKEMRVLEIGCGAGRMTRALSALFGEVHAVDISAGMIQAARTATSDRPNVTLYQNNGMDLRQLPDMALDFALSFIVFQHIPSKAIIESYVRETHRVLKPGRLFKFQVRGAAPSEAPIADTWLGVGLTLDDMQQMAARCGFDLRHFRDPGSQDFWLWFFRK